MPSRVADLFDRPKPIVAVLHAAPSPGVPGAGDVRAAVERVATETKLLVELGVDGLLVENAHDAPALPEGDLGPEVAAYMTRIAATVKRFAGRRPVGVRVLGGANRTALAVALAAGCDFVRVDTWATDPAAAARFHRYQEAVGAGHIPMFADLRARTPAEATELVATLEAMRPAAVTVLGPSYGQRPAEGVLEAVAWATDLPVFVGGGLTAESLPDVVDLADGFLVGSGIKENENWMAPVSEEAVRRLVGAVEYARGQEVRS